MPSARAFASVAWMGEGLGEAAVATVVAAGVVGAGEESVRGVVAVPA